MRRATCPNRWSTIATSSGLRRSRMRRASAARSLGAIATYRGNIAQAGDRLIDVWWRPLASPSPWNLAMPSPRPVVQTNVRHFAINADDMARARRFYERVFGWRFDAWGPPNFFMITTGSDQDPGIIGS